MDSNVESDHKNVETSDRALSKKYSISKVESEDTKVMTNDGRQSKSDSISKVESEKKVEVADEPRGHTYVQWLYAILASSTLLTYGFQGGWISPSTKILKSDQSPTGAALTDSEMSWVGSILAQTAIFGVALYAYIADAYGRKLGILAIAVPQAISWIITIFATSTTTLIIARVFAGIPAGGCFNLVPMYVKEISQDDNRGTMVSITLLMQNFGFLIMYAIGSYLNYYTVLYIVTPVTVLTAVLMVFAPESPAFLVKKEKFEEAAKIIATLRGLDVDDKIVQEELQFMKNEESYYRAIPKITLLNIFKNQSWLRAFILIILLDSAQTFNGNYAIMTYAWTVMSSSGVTVSPELLSLIVPVVMICGSVMSLTCMERIDRKKLLAITYSMSTVAILILATTLLLNSKGCRPPQWIPVVAIGVAVWSYAAGICPVIYVLMTEIFNFQVRSKLIGCIITYGWFVSFCQLAAFPIGSSTLGMHTMFYIFAIFNVFGIVMSLVLPETRGKSVGEIEDVLAGKKLFTLSL